MFPTQSVHAVQLSRRAGVSITTVPSDGGKQTRGYLQPPPQGIKETHRGPTAGDHQTEIQTVQPLLDKGRESRKGHVCKSQRERGRERSQRDGRELTARSSNVAAVDPPGGVPSSQVTPNLAATSARVGTARVKVHELLCEPVRKLSRSTWPQATATISPMAVTSGDYRVIAVASYFISYFTATPTHPSYDTRLPGIADSYELLWQWEHKH